MLRATDLLRFRRDRRGVVQILFILVAVILVAVFIIYVAGIALSPYRQMNDPPKGQECVSYARANGDFAVSAFLGAIHGEIHTINIDTISDPNDHGSVLPAGSVAGKEGVAYVLVSIRGPGGMEVVAWKTPEVHIEIEILFAQLSGESKPGSFETGAACFWEHGESTWTFVLQFQDKGGTIDTLDTQVRHLDV